MFKDVEPWAFCALLICALNKKRVLILNTKDQWRLGGQETHPSTANIINYLQWKNTRDGRQFPSKKLRKANPIFSFSCEIMILLLFRHCPFSKSHKQFFFPSFISFPRRNIRTTNPSIFITINASTMQYTLSSQTSSFLRKQIGIYRTIFLPWLAFVLRVNQMPNKMKVKAQKVTGNDLRFISSIE